MDETTLLVDVLCARVVGTAGARHRCSAKARTTVTLRDLQRAVELPQLPRDWTWGVRIGKRGTAIFDVPLCPEHAHE